jgi:hypothetical protein
MRHRVQAILDEKKTPRVVPLLLSYGGFESGIRKRLDGLQYSMATQGLLPDPRTACWVLQRAESPTSLQ